jgi:hypothetical protein
MFDKIPPLLFLHLQEPILQTPCFQIHQGMGVGVPPIQKENLMNTTTVSSISDSVALPSKTVSARCPYLYPNGKRCSLPVLPSHSGSCSRHGQATMPVALSPLVHQDQSDFTDLSADLLPELSEFSAGADIRQFLARLLVLVTKGRISPRRASVLGYITNQLLHSHRAIDRENFLQLADADPNQRKSGSNIIWDIPGLNPINGETRS